MPNLDDLTKQSQAARAEFALQVAELSADPVEQMIMHENDEVEEKFGEQNFRVFRDARGNFGI